MTFGIPGTLVEQALLFAYKAHGEQERKYSGEPYITHPIAVAAIIRKNGGSEVMIAAALLHDVIEDCGVTGADLYKEGFPAEVVSLVEDLSDVFTKENYPKKNRRERKQLELNRLGEVSKEAKIIKIADMIDNSRTMDPGDDFVDVYAAEKEALLEVLREAHHDLAAQAEHNLRLLKERRSQHG